MSHKIPAIKVLFGYLFQRTTYQMWWLRKSCENKQVMKCAQGKVGDTHQSLQDIDSQDRNPVKISQNNQLLSVTKISQYVHMFSCTSCNKDADVFCSTH